MHKYNAAMFWQEIFSMIFFMGVRDRRAVNGDPPFTRNSKSVFHHEDREVHEGKLEGTDPVS